MSLEYKAHDAIRVIREAAERHVSPVVYSSFGKDSMVMLDLIRRAGLRLPIIFHREPVASKKYAFANQVIQKEDYTVYDWPPVTTQVIETPEGQVELMSGYEAGGGVDYMPIGLIPPRKGKPFHCGMDFYRKPTGTFNFPWDLGFIGHKSCDKSALLGDMPLEVDYLYRPGCSFAFPLRYFTDEDIWYYTERLDLPINTKRYNKNADYREFTDKTHNPDFFETCTNCMKTGGEMRVDCPKTGGKVLNISASLSRLESLPRPTYMGGA